MTAAATHFEAVPASHRPAPRRSAAALASDFLHQLDGNDEHCFIDAPSNMTVEEFRTRVASWAEAIAEDLDPWSWGDALTKPDRAALAAALTRVAELALAGHHSAAHAAWERTWDVRPAA